MADRAVVTHVYRGELTRMLAYRVRLDTTTNWAIGISAAIITFGLGNPEIPHTVMLLALLLDLQLLWLEARRYRAFDLSRRRMKLLERGFVAEVLGRGSDWEERLADSYAEPCWQIGAVAAAGHRVRRNYLWLVLSVLVAWLLKLRLHGEGGMIAAAHVGAMPGAVVLGLMSLLVLVLLGLAAKAPPELPD